ncbi:quercetin dioxygenase-like cupin family protein [Pantoea cypripedii]|nr:quercetin dioxygenase-like cupin family protein [Pantoea cypripedii]
MLKNKTAAFSLSFGLLFSLSALANEMSAMTISKSGSRDFIQGPQENFTGRVWVDPLFRPAAPQRTSASVVTFEPGARSAWHTHPLGQTLVVTAGTGWVQEWGKEKKTIHAGDVVSCPPGVRHWHGATSTTSVSHIAIQETSNEGTNVNWLEKVGDEQYLQ